MFFKNIVIDNFILKYVKSFKLLFFWYVLYLYMFEYKYRYINRYCFIIVI